MTIIDPQNRAGCYATRLVIAVYIATVCASLAAGHSPQYTVVRLGDPGSDIDISGNHMQPWRLNNKGDIIGTSSSGFFLYRGRRVHYLGSVGAPFETRSLLAINDHGVIIGLVQDSYLDYPENAFSFILRCSGRYRDLNLAHAHVLPFPAFVGWDINNQGTWVGEVMGADARRRAVVYESGRLRELPGLVPGGDNFPAAINNRGQVIGTAEANPSSYRPIIWWRGRVHNLGLLPGFSNSYGTAINDHGAAVGWCDNAETAVGFIYRHSALRLLPFPARARYFMPTHINNTGDVLFWFYPRREDEYESYWLYANGRLHDLTPIIANATGLPVHSVSLNDMNDHGVIIGAANYRDSNGAWYSQGIVLIPK